MVKSEISPNDIPVKFLNLWYHEFGYTYILSIKSGLVRVNFFVEYIWEAINGHNNIHDIHMALSEIFPDVDPHLLFGAVLDTIYELYLLEIITITPEPK